jgi:hypothetical protein
MKHLKRFPWTLGMAVVLVGVCATPVLANPPYPGSTYYLYANGQTVGVLTISPDGNKLASPSYVNADCTNSGYAFTAHMVVDGLQINNPAGIINAFLPASGPNQRVFKQDKGGAPSNWQGTMSDPRFFIRWFPSNSGAPTQSPPQGPPGGGQQASGPGPGDIGTGNVSGRNNPPSARNQAWFCSFSLNFFAQKA